MPKKRRSEFTRRKTHTTIDSNAAKKLRQKIVQDYNQRKKKKKIKNAIPSELLQMSLRRTNKPRNTLEIDHSKHIIDTLKMNSFPNFFHSFFRLQNKQNKTK